ncbi:MAG: CHRD domain-containing protein [Candidatus Bipolaricaulota bacterium]|nr:CHRD domain-containing protein [Candidatus Bipolaricaulota bacterium]MCS7274892.1 CHRD domain-containing protein [Candidatus Bipolaricaulota bacterium]MDW8111171.1 CHRD domain-containing protein [Candidatus Bipolaricaulota bacterium]MDW8329919.1 CHRD domain-containing protein [Candidatus Bipolaricaulota bacterium]
MTKMRVLSLSVLALVIVLTFALGERALAPYHGGSPHQTQIPSAQEVIVRIEGSNDPYGYGTASFNPATVNIAPGTTVTWVNEDSIAHNVTSRDGLFDSPVLNRGQRFSYKFDRPGTYGYFCKIHPAMTGQVIVAGQAGPTLLTAVLTAGQEVPAPKAETPLGAIGAAAIVLNANRTELSFFLGYSGLSGSPTAMHFHRGKPGEAGPIVRTICPVLGVACPTGTSATLSGVWRRDDAREALTSDLVDALLKGELYINIHTSLNPPGEIRGQVKPYQP